MLFLKFIYNFVRIITRAIIDNNDLVRIAGNCLHGNCLKAVFEQGGAIIGWNDDGIF